MWRKEEANKKEVENTAQKDLAASVQEFIPASEKNSDEMQEEMEAYMAENHTGKKNKKHTKWSRKTKLIVAGAGVLVRLGGAKILLGGSKEVLPMVTATPLTKGDVTAILTLNGPISGTDSADVMSNLHSEVLDIFIKEGDHVTKGQTLARLDSTNVKKSVDIAQNTYDLAVSEYDESTRDAQSNYEKAVQDYNTAKLNYDRNQVLFDAGDISSADFETAGNAMRDAKRTMENFTIVKGRAIPNKSYELKVKSAQFELEQKKTDLENTEVKSPIDGTVVRVNSKVGQFADKPENDKPMFIVENLKNLEMEIAVSEYSVGKVRIGQKAEIKADILNGKTVEGEIISISPTGEEKGGGSTERVVPTTIRIGDSNSGLIAGITARASVVTGEVKDVFKVAQLSLVEDAAQGTCIVSVDPTSHIVHFIPVTLGVESDLEVEIIPNEEGALTDKLMIITSPTGLTEGMTVTLQ
ncbi:MAG: efflux RND transporter periplasmic adaptor subunit [Clostridium sp.]